MATDSAFTFGVVALTTQRDPFPRVIIEVDTAEDVIGVAVARIYALHGLRVTRQQVVGRAHGAVHAAAGVIAPGH